METVGSDSDRIERLRVEVKQHYHAQAGRDIGSGRCDDCSSPLTRGKAYRIPGNKLWCEACTDKFLHADYIDWPKALRNIQQWLGPGLPGHIVDIAEGTPSTPAHQNVTSEQQLLPPKQWYPDPAGRHQWRFWDGSSWTPHVADAGAASFDPLPSADEERRSAALATLVPALFIGGTAARAEAARALGELGDRRAVAPLLELGLTRELGRGEAIDAALQSLAALGDPSVVPPLVAAFLDQGSSRWGSPEVLAALLARLGDRATLAPLVDKMTSTNSEYDDDDFTHSWEMDAAEFIVSKSTRERQNERSDDCATVLAASGDLIVDDLLPRLGRPRVNAFLADMPTPPVDRLIPLAYDVDTRTRLDALWILSEVATRGIQRPSIEDVLRSAREVPDRQTQHAAIAAIDRLGGSPGQLADDG